LKTLLLFFAIFAFTASAAEVAGKWKAAIETPNGNFETTFVFKVDGDKLTGTVSGPGGDQPIADGKVDGDTVTFAVTGNYNGNEFKLNYKGKVAGDELKLTLSFPGREQTFEITAKRAS
jgi:hypothetical protein